MSLPKSTRAPGLVPMALAAFAAATMVVTSAPAASAHDPNPDRSAGELQAGEAQVLSAMQRDLGLSRPEAVALMDAAAGVDEVAEQLRAELGAVYGGSWFDQESLSLVVAVTDAAAASVVRAAGAQPKLVQHSAQELESIRADLDAQVTADPDSLADAHSWSVDVEANEVVLTVRSGSASSVASVASEFGDALRIEESVHEPTLLNHDNPWLDGGVQYTMSGWSCSVGFLARNSSGNRFFLTAGHCGGSGNAAHGGTWIGSFASYTFPGSDRGLVNVSNSYWAVGPYVWNYPGAIVIQGARNSGVGTPVCKSGMTTRVTCGTITNKNVTVNYPQGAVFGMGQHNACTEPGDSGGATYSTAGGRFAEGMTSGGQMIGGQCLEKHGMPNVTYYQEVTPALAAYGVQLY